MSFCIHLVPSQRFFSQVPRVLQGFYPDTIQIVVGFRVERSMDPCRCEAFKFGFFGAPQVLTNERNPAIRCLGAYHGAVVVDTETLRTTH